MSHKILTISLLLVLSGCSPRVLPLVTEHTADTVIRERIYRDTVRITIPVISERVVTEDTVSHLENDYARSDARVERGLLFHSLETKNALLSAPAEIVVHDTTVVVKQSETIIQEVERRLTWWQQTKMNLFWVLLCLAILNIIIWVIKKNIRI